MPDIRPFQGVRYDLARVGDLSDVVAPPYDVIDAELQARLYDASPYNVIRLELNRREPADDASNNPYTRAARTLKVWLKDQVLRPDPTPSYYLCHQVFEVDGQTHTRKGFLARVRLEPFGEGSIFPHEQTLAGPKADRLALFHATRYNLSPIFGLYPDDNLDVMARAEKGVRDRTPLEVRDHLGVVSRLWEVQDLETLSALQQLMAGKPVFIADGHHRYETGLKYRDDKVEAEGPIDGNDPANFCMMMLVGMSDPGLIIQPTHRLVQGYPNIDSATLQARLAPQFVIHHVGEGDEGCRAAWEAIQLHDDQDLLAFGTSADQQWFTAKLRNMDRMNVIAAEHGEEWRSLGVSLLHELVLKDLIGKIGAAHCQYVHRAEEVAASVKAGQCDIGCLVAPAGMEYVEAIASNHEKMPPKSTYFYPKLLSGLVLNPIG